MFTIWLFKISSLFLIRKFWMTKNSSNWRTIKLKMLLKIQICASLSKKWSYKIMQTNNAYVDIFENSNCHDDRQFFFQRKFRFKQLQLNVDIRIKKLIKNIRIRWNSIYLMFCRVYQLRIYVNNWIERDLKNLKISKIKLNDDQWSMILLIDNMLNFFYEFILIIFRTTNANIHLNFRLYDVLYVHINTIENLINVSDCS